MPTNLKFMIATLSIVAMALAGCNSGEQTGDHSSMDMDVPGVVTAAPDYVTVLAETEFAQAFTITLPPGGMIPNHRHNPGAGYVLRGGTVTVHGHGDSARELTLETGKGMFGDVNLVTSIHNTGMDTVSVLILERKPGTELPPVPADQSPDAVTASGDNYRTVIENDAFRVVRMSLASGDRDEWHSHPNEMVHFLVGGAGRIHMPDGATQDIEVPAGATIFMPATKTHSVEGIGDGPIEAVIVEMKPTM
jgi:beta-alanine degradation protein BauB